MEVDLSAFPEGAYANARYNANIKKAAIFDDSQHFGLTTQLLFSHNTFLTTTFSLCQLFAGGKKSWVIWVFRTSLID